MMAARGEQTKLAEWRCHQCGRILAKVQLASGTIIEIKCRCNALNYKHASG